MGQFEYFTPYCTLIPNVSKIAIFSIAIFFARNTTIRPLPKKRGERGASYKTGRILEECDMRRYAKTTDVVDLMIQWIVKTKLTLWVQNYVMNYFL